MFFRPINNFLLVAVLATTAANVPLRADEAPAAPAQAAAETASAPVPRGLRGLRPGETPEQQRERLLVELELQTGELTAEQKTRLKEIYIAAADELAEARDNKSLSEEEGLAVQRKVRAEMPEKIEALLTEAQLTRLKQAQAEQQQKAENPQWNGGLQPGETLARRRVRLLKDYEAALTDLTPLQKAGLLSILETADDVIAAIQKDDSRTPEQKQKVVARVQLGVSTKIETVLTQPQLAKWHKVREQRLKEAQKKKPVEAAKPVLKNER